MTGHIQYFEFCTLNLCMYAEHNDLQERIEFTPSVIISNQSQDSMHFCSLRTEDHLSCEYQFTHLSHDMHTYIMPENGKKYQITAASSSKAYYSS